MERHEKSVKSACYGDPKKYAVGFYEQIFLFYLKK
jgi:hypothetical protein